MVTGTATATTGKLLALAGAGGGGGAQLLEFETGWSRHSWSPALHSLKTASGGRPVHMSGLPGCMVILSREASWAQLSGTLPLRLFPVTVLQAGRQRS